MVANVNATFFIIGFIGYVFIMILVVRPGLYGGIAKRDLCSKPPETST